MSTAVFAQADISKCVAAFEAVDVKLPKPEFDKAMAAADAVCDAEMGISPVAAKTQPVPTPTANTSTKSESVPTPSPVSEMMMSSVQRMEKSSIICPKALRGGGISTEIEMLTQAFETACVKNTAEREKLFKGIQKAKDVLEAELLNADGRAGYLLSIYGDYSTAMANLVTSQTGLARQILVVAKRSGKQTIRIGLVHGFLPGINTVSSSTDDAYALWQERALAVSIVTPDARLAARTKTEIARRQDEEKIENKINQPAEQLARIRKILAVTAQK